MILQSLNDLYDRLSGDAEYEVAPPGYSLQKITFKVVLTLQGQLHAIVDARQETDRGLRPRQVLVLGAPKQPGAGLNPCFLWDNSGYMLGYQFEDMNPERTRKTFEAFRTRHLEAEESISCREYSAVCRFLETWKPDSGSDHIVLQDAGVTGFGVFQIVGRTEFVHQVDAIKSWWQTECERGRSEILGQCLVSGAISPLARIHDKIRGVAGTQGAGGSIVSFNEPAYESYGQEQSFNAPVSESVAFRYTTALNAILDGPMRAKHRMTLGDTTIAFWTGTPTATEDIFLAFANKGSGILEDDRSQDEGRRQRVGRFLRAIRKGGAAYDDLDRDPRKTPFYLLGLSPNAGRISVRFFERGTLSHLLDNLRQHHADIRLTPRSKHRDPEFPPAHELLLQTAREAKNVPPILAGPLVRAIVGGHPYSHGLFSAVVRRLHVDPAVTYLRCCVIKGYLNRNLDLEVSMSLDTARPDPPYRLGRLFAALEKTQKDALGGALNKTIRDTFYSSASATPGSVFPRLLRTYQHHLSKMEGGLRIGRERLIQSILDPLTAFPSHLSLDDQGLFAIGYYHQTNDFYTKHETAADN